jgi:superfamily II DNA or RNA helicase
LNTPASSSTDNRRLVFEVSLAAPPHVCFVSTFLMDEETGQVEVTTPSDIFADPSSNHSTRLIAKLLGCGDASRTPIGSNSISSVLGLLSRLGKARWQATGKTLVHGEERVFQADTAPDLPPNSAVIMSDAGPWYVDGATGTVGRIKVLKAQAPKTVSAPPSRSGIKKLNRAPVSVVRPRFKPAPIRAPQLRQGRSLKRPSVLKVTAEIYEPEYQPTPVLSLHYVDCADGLGNIRRIDALMLDFDYDGIITHADDERQILRPAAFDLQRVGDDGIRRNRKVEAAAVDTLRRDGFSQMRISDGPTAKGRMVFVYRSEDASERWLSFIKQRIPALVALGWRNEIDRNFGPSYVQSVGNYDVQITDSDPGTFSLDFGIEIEGKRIPLLPILYRLLDRGGIDSAQVVDGELITHLDDGRLLKLPAERMRRLLSVMRDLIDAAGHAAGTSLKLPDNEISAVLELEDVLSTRWENSAAIEEYARWFRGNTEIPVVTVPPQLLATLRPYQQHGVNWLQHLREHDFGAFLADDMGLGKTIQVIAHIVIEKTEGRLNHPALIVVPTSLVANWTAELAKFSPHLQVSVLHGTNRHARRAEIDRADVVITTYGVLARDIEEMTLRKWHLVVLDEAQVIKNPDAKATQAVCQLDAHQRLCLSGTPIENNLQELWSEFAFLMPSLLGDRRGFAKRFRTPIEIENDPVRRLILARRIKPFLLRRTKAEVATDLPPKHTILRRINLAPAQRELYETIRGTLYDKVREKIPELTAAQSKIVILDALLKLRQVCCDPRLVKLESARLVDASSKLDNLIEMVDEMIKEGRRILLFSQFTSMLDLIKPRLDEIGIKFVELRGTTRNRAEPVDAFQNGEVPLFLISLKAGGRGLNLTSADTVIHYDPWWNPAAEDQASDRAYRIGQTKPVFVYKLIAADTVEDRIIKMQERKAGLANIALSEVGDFSQIEAEDLDYLFSAGENSRAA